MDAAAAEPAAQPTTVMVPVPHELVVEVQQYVVRLQWLSVGVQAWSTEQLVELLGSVDGDTVTLLRTVATAKVTSDREVLDTEAARRMGVSVREVAGLVREINDGGPPGLLDLVVLQRSDDPTTVERRLMMIEEHAVRVLEAIEQRDAPTAGR